MTVKQKVHYLRRQVNKWSMQLNNNDGRAPFRDADASVQATAQRAMRHADHMLQTRMNILARRKAKREG